MEQNTETALLVMDMQAGILSMFPDCRSDLLAMLQRPLQMPATRKFRLYM